MSKNKDVFVYLGTYSDEGEAEQDLHAVKDLHEAGVIGTYDAAVVAKDNGDIHVHKVEKPTQHGVWTGLGVGAVVGVLFPPALVGTALAGGVAGGLVGHFTRGMSRKDLKDLGESLDEGDAALIVIGRDRLSEKLDKAVTHANKLVEREVDMEGRELERQLAAS